MLDGWKGIEMDLVKHNNQSVQSLSEFDLFLRGDVQVLESGIEQQVLVDLVSRDFDFSVHVGLGRQMHLQHLQETQKLH